MNQTVNETKSSEQWLPVSLAIGESRDDFAAFRAGILSELVPSNAVEEFWTEQIIDAAWQMRRLIAARSEIYNRAMHAELARRIRNTMFPYDIIMKDQDDSERLATDYLRNDENAIRKVVSIIGPVSAHELLLAAYAAAMPSVTLVEKAVDLLASRYDVALGNIHKRRAMAAPSEAGPRKLERT